jgi:hypothetical protein
MNMSRGIFDQAPSVGSSGHVNPFSFAEEASQNNPFSATPLVPQSPFAAMPDMAQDSSLPEPGKPAKIPAPRSKGSESPFQLAVENGHAFGFEAPVASPFAIASPPVAKPVEQLNAPMPMQQNPFSIHREAPSAATAAPIQETWPQATVPAPASPQPLSYQPHYSEETHVYRQLELRAIFGVDREMSGDEILQRTRSLPGVKHVACIASQDVLALESLKRTLHSLGFGSGNMRLYSGSVPIEFVREGSTILAVQTDGGFAPGIRETIMIVARELDKMSSATA